jgi:hypothetical protein
LVEVVVGWVESHAAGCYLCVPDGKMCEDAV